MGLETSWSTKTSSSANPAGGHRPDAEDETGHTRDRPIFAGMLWYEIFIADRALHVIFLVRNVHILLRRGILICVDVH